jgi:hypothetical protein
MGIDGTPEATAREMISASGQTRFVTERTASTFTGFVEPTAILMGNTCAWQIQSAEKENELNFRATPSETISGDWGV